MPFFVADGYISFTATDNGTTLTPIGAPSQYSLTKGRFIVFDDGDGNADVATEYAGAPSVGYTGYTIEINGNHYAIFNDGDPTYFVPFFNSVEDLSGLDGTNVTQPITQSGDNAAVDNLCFMGGTRIATPLGARRVEELAIGDLVTTAGGGAVRVLWIGRQQVRHPANVVAHERWAPVRIAAGALGNHADLFVSADHGMVLDGYVINASALVNGGTIRFVPAAELPPSFTYYHIETQGHEAILAEGAPAETFIDVAGRRAFDNYQEYLDLYGVERIVPPQPLPRISAARHLPPAIKRQLSGATRAA
jgi:hypothetical protein